MIQSVFYTLKFILYYTIFYYSEEEKAKNLRMFLESMGPVYIKFGQLLSTHKHWLNNYQYTELCKLRDNIKLPYDISYLKNQMLEYNLYISNKSISNGSIATVHLGKYNNQNVVVKVKRKNIEKDMYYTLLFFKPFAYISQYIPIVWNLNIFKKFKKIEYIMNEQCNFNKEIHYIEKFGQLYSNIVKIPKVYKEISNNELIVMEYIPSETTDDILKTISVTDREQISKIMFGFLVTSINLRGLFHSDLHNGNFGWINTNGNYKLVIYDFGMIGKLSENNRIILNEFYSHLINKNIDETIKTITKFIIKGVNDNNREFFMKSMRSVLEVKFKENNLNAFSWIKDLLFVINNLNLGLHYEFTSFELALISFDGIITQLSSNQKNYMDFMKEILL